MGKNPFKFEIPAGKVACGGILRLYPNEDQIKELYRSM